MVKKVVSFDFDGCLCNAIVEAELKTLFEKKSREKVTIEEIVQIFKKHTANFSLMAGYDEVCIGTNRQDISVDYRNAEGHSSYVSAYPVFKALFGDKLNPLLLPDIYNKLKSGETFSSALKQLERGIFHTTKPSDSNPISPPEDSKISMVYAQIQELSLKYPDEEIEYTFSDDKIELLERLYHFFSDPNNGSLIPKNIKLNFVRYGKNTDQLQSILKDSTSLMMAIENHVSKQNKPVYDLQQCQQLKDKIIKEWDDNEYGKIDLLKEGSELIEKLRNVNITEGKLQEALAVIKPFCDFVSRGFNPKHLPIEMVEQKIGKEIQPGVDLANPLYGEVVVKWADKHKLPDGSYSIPEYTDDPEVYRKLIDINRETKEIVNSQFKEFFSVMSPIFEILEQHTDKNKNAALLKVKQLIKTTGKSVYDEALMKAVYEYIAVCEKGQKGLKHLGHSDSASLMVVLLDKYKLLDTKKLDMKIAGKLVAKRQVDIKKKGHDKLIGEYKKVLLGKNKGAELPEHTASLLREKTRKAQTESRETDKATTRVSARPNQGSSDQ